MLLSLTPSSSSLPCINFTHSEFSTFDSDDCVGEGLIVYHSHRTGSICDRQVKCPEEKHLKLNPNSEQDCFDSCKCPEWASGCSFFEGTAILNSTNENERVMNAIQPLMPEICAIGEPKEGCSKNPVKQQLMRAQLYDGTDYLLTETKIFYQIWNEPKCIGNGNITTGSAAYCEKNTCRRDGTKYCRYVPNELVMLLVGNEKIPLRAYGLVTMEIYPPKEPDIKCSTCVIMCQKGAVGYEVDVGINGIELCVEATCHRISNPLTKTSLPLPMDVVARPHNASLFVWRKN